MSVFIMNIMLYINILVCQVCMQLAVWMSVFGSLRCISGICSCDETLGHVSHPEWRAVGGPIRKPVTTDRGNSCPPMNVLLGLCGG